MQGKITDFCLSKMFCEVSNMFMEMPVAYYDSPAGLIEVRADSNVIVSLRFCGEENKKSNHSMPEVLTDCICQLDEYFKGRRRNFNVPFWQAGTDFQQKVWKALTGIPYGQTVSYADIAQQAGNPKSARAAGTANGQNKIWIIVPCHRVVGSNGSLTGYAGGIERKKWLLAHEAQVSRSSGQAVKSGTLNF